MRNLDLYPDINRNQRLLKTLTAFFGAQPGVYEMAAFGSLASDEADRWSDLDLLIVTDTADVQAGLFKRLKDYKAVRYHRPFMRDAPGLGAYVSGVTFQDESIFHTLDLNFLTLIECTAPDGLARFGAVRQLHRMIVAPARSTPTSHYGLSLPGPPETVAEARIYTELSALRKTLRRVMRGLAGTVVLREALKRLRTVLEDYPDGTVSTGGDICELAWRCVIMAEITLKTET